MIVFEFGVSEGGCVMPVLAVAERKMRGIRGGSICRERAGGSSVERSRTTVRGAAIGEGTEGCSGGCNPLACGL